MNDAISDVIHGAVSDANRYPFLFIGSGLSRRYMGAPNWLELLEIICSKSLKDPTSFRKYRMRAQVAYHNNQVASTLPYVASLMEPDVNEALLDNGEFIADHAIEIDKGYSPIKILASEIIGSYKFEAQQETRLLAKAGKGNISGVITTNYDYLCEKLFPSFNVYEGQNGLLFAEPSYTRDIFKIHGSASQPNSLVLTDADYKDFSIKRKYLSAKLLTVFLEYPVIFLGYSIQDENIKTILSDIAECLDEQSLQRLAKRLIFVEWKPTTAIDKFTMSFGNKLISMTQIQTDDFSSLYEALLQTEKLYDTKLLKELQGSIFKLADKVSPDSPIVASGIDNALNQLRDDQRVIIGFTPSPESYGRPLTPEQIFEDVVLDNLRFDNSFIVSNYLNKFVQQQPNNMPIFKYIRGSNGSIGPKIIRQAENMTSLDSIRNATIRKNLSKTRSKHAAYLSVSGLRNKLGDAEAIKLIPYLNEDEIDIDELELLLRDELKANDTNKETRKTLFKDTNYRKCIRIYDFMRYREKDTLDLPHQSV